MRPLAWILGAGAAALWSGFGWLLYRLAGAGGGAVVAVTRWLEIEPSATQWLADGLDMAGGILQAIVVLLWLAGILLLAAVFWLLGRVTGVADGGNPRDGTVYGPQAAHGQQVVDGEVLRRDGDRHRPDDGQSG